MISHFEPDTNIEFLIHRKVIPIDNNTQNDQTSKPIHIDPTHTEPSTEQNNHIPQLIRSLLDPPTSLHISQTTYAIFQEVYFSQHILRIEHEISENPNRSPSVSPACLRRCSLRLSFLFLAVLFVPPVASKPNEDGNE
ncbi:unnamed protein product [Trifolium pratense]|uniref:Uncharacterized protein n=1 Tax=Trifolium pratense TaxID=57577 RepID=A0ACB0LSW2_TRIPR|nr:unnamed protein product [Trifolium pratense]